MDPSDVASLRERYAGYEDHHLVAIALTAATDLVPVARELLKAELATRKLVPELWPTFDVPVDRMSAKELDALALRLQFLPCPTCGSTGTSLNGFNGEKPTPAVLVGVHFLTGFRIGCQRCLAKHGVWRLFKLKPGQRWKPSPAFHAWVLSHAALFVRFGANEAAMAALLRLDYGGFLRAIAPAGR